MSKIKMKSIYEIMKTENRHRRIKEEHGNDYKREIIEGRFCVGISTRGGVFGG